MILNKKINDNKFLLFHLNLLRKLPIFFSYINEMIS